MNELKEMIELSVRGIGYTVLDYRFIFAVWLISIIYRRMKFYDYYKTTKRKPFRYMLADIVLQGIIVGAITSIVIMTVGVPLYFSEYLALLMPFALLLSIFKMRFICISYPAGLLVLISLLLNGQTIFNITLPDIQIHIPSIITIVGILHIMEGLLVMLTAHKEAVPVLSEKNGQLIMGHFVFMNWPVPLSLLVVAVGTARGEAVITPEWWPLYGFVGLGAGTILSLFPAIGTLGYHSVTFSQEPKKRMQKSGLLILIYSICLLIIGYISVQYQILQIVGAFFMVALHEVVHWSEQQSEKKNEPLYTLPKEGVRIMQVVEGGYAEELGWEKGDIIEQIDQYLVEDIQHLLLLFKTAKDKVCIQTRNIKGEVRQQHVEDAKKLNTIGIRIVPEKPILTFERENLEKMGIYEFFHHNITSSK